LHRNASQVMDGLVMATYQTINTRQTVEYVREQHQKWGVLGRKKATVMQVCNERLGLSTSALFPAMPLSVLDAASFWLHVHWVGGHFYVLYGLLSTSRLPSSE
jgi:hypothetical protein